MPVVIPQVVRRAWGEEVVAEFVPWMEERLHEIIQARTVPRDEYREVLSRLDGLEKDISLIKEEQALFRVDLGQMRAEFKEDRARMRAEFKEDRARMRAEFREDQAQMRAEFREDLGELRREMHERFDRVNERFDRVNERFDQMHARFDEMYHQMVVQTRWLIGALAVIGTVISVLLAIAQFAS